MVENFGSYLKHERELRGVPLEEISGATKIHIRFLQALEDNKFDELPGEVFIKGYIRSYANTIGSDVEEMLNIYEESVGNKINEKNTDLPSASTISAKNFLGIAFAALIVLALIFGTKILIFDKNNSTAKKDNLSSSLPDSTPKKETFPKIKNDSLKEELTDNNLPLSDVSVKEEVAKAKKELETLKLEPEIQKQENSLVLKEGVSPENLEKALKLTIMVKNNSWFNMTIDNFREEDFILSAGEEKSYWGNEVFRLTIGNRQGTDIFLNGKSLVLPESKENVVKDFIINSKLIE